MPRRRRAELPPAEAPAPPAAVHTIAPTAVYQVASAAAALGLRRSCIKVAVRRGELRYAVKGNRYLFLGSWLLEWIGPGQLRTACNGAAPDGKAVPRG
jgi:hypothetical protein